jgi:hypothetical protein
MAEAKENYIAGDNIISTEENQRSKNANDGGGFRDSLNGGETISGATTPQACYIDETDGELYACDGNDIDKIRFDGFVISDTTDGNPAEFQGSGIVRGFSGLTIGSKYYLQDDGTIGTSIGTYEVLVGIATSETELLIEKGSFQFIGSESFNDNSPSSGNPAVSTFTIPDLARFVIINLLYTRNISSTKEIARGEMTLSVKGKTSGSLRNGFSYGSNTLSTSASISGDTLTITTQNNGSTRANNTGTVYFYN